MSSRSDVITAPLGRIREVGFRSLGPLQIGSLLAVLLVSAVVGNYLFIMIWGTGQRPAPTYSIGVASRGTITSLVNASGTVASTRQVRLSFTTGGKIAKLSVAQGDRVQEGQEIAVLDTTALQVKRDTAESQLRAAQTRLQALLDGPTAADLAAQQQAVASAQASLTRAQNDLQNVLTGITPEDVAAARANLERAKAALDRAQSDYDKIVRGEDLTLRTEYTALQAARADYQQALTAYNNKVTPNPSDVAAARASLESARNALAASQERLNILLNPNPADIAAAQAAVQSAQAQLDAARQRYTALVIGGSLQERQAAQAAVDAAQAQLDAARARLAQLGSGSQAASDAELLNAQAAVAQAEAQLVQAKNNLAKLQGATGGPELAAAEQAQRAAEQQLATAQNNLNKLLNPPPADLLAAQQAVALAQANLSTAQSNHDRLVSPSADELAQVRATLDRARAALEKAQYDWDRLVNRIDLDQRPEATALKAAQADYAAALNSYNLKSGGPKAGDVQTAHANVQSAQAQLAAAQARLDQMKAGSLPSDIAQQRETVAQLELALKAAQNDLDNAVLRAPFAGTIVALSVNQGDQVGAGTAIATLLDPNLVRIDATLDESNVTRVKQDMRAIVTFDAIQGRPFIGRVAVVTPAGTTTQGVVTYPIVVVFDPQGTVIPAGLTATVRIITESKANVITVPSRAVRRQGSDRVVDVVGSGGKLEPRTVKVGLTGDAGTVEITEGLSEGERIAIPTTQRSSTSQSGGAFGAGGLPGFGAPPAAAPVRR